MRNYYLYLVSLIFILIPVSASRPMTSLYAEELHASMLEIGVLTACYSLTPFLVAVFAGRFIDRFGEKLPLIICSIGMCFSLSLPFFFPKLSILYLSQLLLGGSQLLGLVAIQNGAAGSVTAEKRDQAIATMSLFASIGLMLGPLIGGYSTEHLGFQNSYLFFSSFLIIAFAMSLFIGSTYHKGNKVSNREVFRMKELLAIPGLKRSIFVSMLTLAAIDIFYVYYPLYASSIGMTPSQIGWLLTITGSASVFVRIFIPRLVTRYGRVRVLSIFMFCGAISYGLIPFFQLFIFIALVATFIGMGLGIAQPLTTILSYNLAPEGRTAEVLGIRLAGNRLSQVIIPLVFAGVSTVTGLGAIFTIEALLLGVGAFLAKGIQEDHQESVIHKK
jgi:MFS family permease